MSMSFGNAGGSAFGASASGPGAQAGPDLQDISTEGLGFSSIAGDAKLRLLPTPWPVDNLPPPTSNLLSVASHKGLVAAAGPDAVIIATTEAVRKGFEAPASGDNEVRSFQPQLSIPMPMRVSQLTFTADENYLVLSAESGGGLAVYDVQAMLGGSTQSAFEIPTNSQSLRALVPNPTPEKGELIAVVTNDGDLLMANLKEKDFVNGPNGKILKGGVSCVSWSTKGKQLVAGLGNGTAYQMTPEGEGKAEIPKPGNIEEEAHVSSITWLENHVFLVAHTPTSFDQSMAPNSVFNIITRQPPASYTFQKIPEPVGPFGLNRSPPHHFTLRLKDFPPNLQDALVVASTASADIGLFTRSKTPLTSTLPADQITNVFTMTEMADDSRRAQLPMNEEMSDTSPIGTALDLSAKEKVIKPIPGEEMAESPTPVPLVYALNHEGVLAAWWFIYADSIRAGTAYPGLIASGAQVSAVPQAPATSSPFGAAVSNAPALGQSAFGGAASKASPFSSFANNSAPAFGAPSSMGSAPAFGTSAFGSTSSIGKSASPWGTSSTTGNTSSTPAFGAPSFGSPNMPGSGGDAAPAPAFGATTSIGNRSSPWASAASTFGKPSAFGSPSAGSTFGAASASPFGAASGGSSGFASFANKGGFGSVTDNSTSNSGSIFATKSGSSGTFGSGNNDTKDSEMDTGSVFGVPSAESKPAGSLFGSGGGFSLTSTFKPEASENEPGPKSAAKDSSFFGSGFGNALSAPVPESKETEMEDDSKPEPAAAPASTTPFASPAVSKSPFQTTNDATPAPASGLFGIKPNSPEEKPKPFTSLFGQTKPAVGDTKASEEEAKPFSSIFGQPKPTDDKAKAAQNPFASFGQQKSADKDAKPFPSLFGQPSPAPPKPSSPVPAETTSSTSEATVKKEPESPRIKEEPQEDDDDEAFKAMPEAPLPPDPMSRPSYAAGDTSLSSTETADTEPPLPPDFVKESVSTATENEDKGSSKPSIDPSMIPPVDVPGGPAEEEDESDFASEEPSEEEDQEFAEEESEEPEESDEGSDEGSGVDVTQEISPSSQSSKTAGITPESSFGGLASRSPDSPFTKISRPQEKPRPLFGEMRFGQSQPVFPPPNTQNSPRSPSPMRAIPGRLVRPDNTRSVSAPGMASDLLNSKMGPPPTKPHPRAAPVKTIEQREQEARTQVAARAQKEADDLQAFIDREADAMEEHLKSDIVGTKTLDEFVAHQDYVGDTKASSIPAHVEIVYRDIASMIDTLGINSRSLQSFIKGHSELYKDPGRTREDLEEDDDWCLVEIEDLSNIIEKDLTKQLNAGRVKDVDGKLREIRDLLKELVRLRAKHEDVKKLVSALSDPDQLAVARSQPLSSEQAAQQHDIRKDFTKVQKLLAEVEEALTVLKASIASHAGPKTSGTAVPTVEAVVRTIKKMTTMAEKRSGDVDLLENQMRKLRLESVERESSPFATPQKKASLRNPRESTYGLFFTPESNKGTPRNFHASFASSVFSPSKSTPPRKKLNGFTEDEKFDLRSRQAQRRDTANKLRLALQRTSGRVRAMDD